MRALALFLAFAMLAAPASAQWRGSRSTNWGSTGGWATTGPNGSASVTLDAMPYTRTVSCGTYTLTGTYTGAVPTWSASPSGASGSCSDSGGGAFSCAVDVDPDAVGEGVETITVGTESVTIGFYVDGEHSCFLSQSVDGSYNSTLSDLDAVATWENLGTSALDVTQGVGANQPTFRTGIVSDQPMVRCDGGDRIAASTASDWTFMNNSADWSSEIVFATTSSNPNALLIPAATATSIAAGVRGLSLYMDDRAASSRNNRIGIYSSNGTTAIYDGISNDNVVTAGAYNTHAVVQDDDGGGGNDMILLANGTQVGTLPAGTYSALAPTGALTLCAESGGGSELTGDLFRVLIYQSALDATQRGINEAVDEWALGGTLPVTPPTLHLDASYLASVTTASSAVSSWRSTGSLTVAAAQGTGLNQPTHSGTGSTAKVDFDGTNDSLSYTATLGPTATSWHMVAVVTPEVVNTNVTGSSCYTNDPVYIDGTSYRGMLFRKSGSTVYAIGYNYDSNADCIETVYTGGEGTRAVVDVSLSGGLLGIGLDGGSLTTMASSGTGSITNSGFFGSPSSPFYDGAIHEFFFFPAALSSGDRTALIDELKTKWGIP